MELMISLSDKTDDFILGMECGIILNQMNKQKYRISNGLFPIRKENKGVIKRMCKGFNYTPFFGISYYNEWVDFFAIKNFEN